MPAPGLVELADLQGDDAFNAAEKSALTNAKIGMYNDDQHRANQEALMQIALSGGKKTFQAGKKTYQQSTPKGMAETEVQQDAAGAGTDGMGSGSSGTPATQSQSGPGAAQMFGMFFKNLMGGSGGYGGMGGGAGGTGAAGAGGGE